MSQFSVHGLETPILDLEDKPVSTVGKELAKALMMLSQSKGLNEAQDLVALCRVMFKGGSDFLDVYPQHAQLISRVINEVQLPVLIKAAFSDLKVLETSNDPA